MITKNDLMKLVQLAYELSKKYKVSHYMIIVSLQLKYSGSYGKCDRKRHIIYIADDISLYKAIQVIHHEFRHAWQAKYYSDIYGWWTSHKKAYYAYYKQYLNVIELDARIFGRTLGDRNAEHLLRFYNSNQLDVFAEHDCLDLAQSILMLATRNNWIDPFIWKECAIRILKKRRLI